MKNKKVRDIPPSARMTRREIFGEICMLIGGGLLAVVVGVFFALYFIVSECISRIRGPVFVLLV